MINEGEVEVEKREKQQGNRVYCLFALDFFLGLYFYVFISVLLKDTVERSLHTSKDELLTPKIDKVVAL